MTAVLADAAGRVEFPAVPGISARALSEVLARMARIARADGTFLYGLRASRVAELTRYSLRTVRRAQRWLLDNGYLDRVRVGGGRASTHWRIVVEKLTEHLPTPPPGHGTGEPAAPQPGPGGTPQRRTPDIRGMFGRWSRPDAEARPAAPHYPAPIEAVCEEHGSAAGTLPDGQPRCPGCRRTLARLRT